MAGGCLVLVVGPSGAGKDSVLRFAQSRLAGDARFIFPRRFITRTADAMAEDHDSLNAERFAELALRGEFALHWQAHGLSYGIGRGIEADLGRGAVVAVNVSRSIIGEAAGRYPVTVVAEVTASPAIRAARIAARGRESAEDALRRASRAAPLLPRHVRCHRIFNDGALAEAGEAFCALLTGFGDRTG